MSKNLAQVFAANPVTTIGSTDLFYLAASATTDAGITGANLKAQFPSATWNDVAAATQTLAANNGYVSDDGATPVTFTLPATAALGSIIEVAGKGSGGWTIAQLAGQQINFGNRQSTLGVGGSLSSTNQYDYVKLLCITANTTYNVIGGVGNITVV
jgi:hypothetical protein